MMTGLKSVEKQDIWGYMLFLYNFFIYIVFINYTYHCLYFYKHLWAHSQYNALYRIN